MLAFSLLSFMFLAHWDWSSPLFVALTEGQRQVEGICAHLGLLVGDIMCTTFHTASQMVHPQALLFRSLLAASFQSSARHSQLPCAYLVASASQWRRVGALQSSYERSCNLIAGGFNAEHVSSTQSIIKTCFFCRGPHFL